VDPPLYLISVDNTIGVLSDVSAATSPCGICRQFIREFCPLDMPILLVHGDWTKEANDEKIKFVTLEELLPYSFGPEDLKLPRI
jgi:cytidine deaminase